MTKFMLTILGEDQPGIISNISNHLSSQKANVEDVQASIMSGYFTMVLFFTCNEPCDIVQKREIFEKELVQSLAKTNCKVFLDKIDENFEPKVFEEVSTVTISAKDRPGLLAHFSKFCSRIGISITSLRTVKYGESFFIFAGLDKQFSSEEISELIKGGKELGMQINFNINKP